MGGSNFVTPSFVPDFSSDGLLEAALNISATGTVVTPVSGKRIAVFAVHMVAATASSMTVQDVNGTIGAAGGSTVAITGPMALSAGQPHVLPYIGYPWWTCAPGDGLIFSFATAGQVSGRIIYAQG
jgi:hypothetical protein